MLLVGKDDACNCSGFGVERYLAANGVLCICQIVGIFAIIQPGDSSQAIGYHGRRFLRGGGRGRAVRFFRTTHSGMSKSGIIIRFCFVIIGRNAIGRTALTIQTPGIVIVAFGRRRYGRLRYGNFLPSHFAPFLFFDCF